MSVPEEKTEFFFRLSPTRVLQAVEAAGFVPSGHCFALNALENRVYDVRLDDGKHVVAKFYRPGRWSRDTILDEHRLLAALVDAEIPVCAPLKFPDGDTLHDPRGWIQTHRLLDHATGVIERGQILNRRIATPESLAQFRPQFDRRLYD